MKKMKDELDEFIITTHYSLMKQSFTVLNAIEGSLGIFLPFILHILVLGRSFGI